MTGFHPNLWLLLLTMTLVEGDRHQQLQHLNCTDVCRKEGHDLPHYLMEEAVPHGHVRCQGKTCIVLSEWYNKLETPRPWIELPVRGNSKNMMSNKVCAEKVSSVLEVETSMDITGIRGIDQIGGFIEFDMYVTMQWSDPNIGVCECDHMKVHEHEHHEHEPYHLGPDFEDEIWVPDLVIWDYKTFHRMEGLVKLNDMELMLHDNCPARILFGLDVLVKMRCDMTVSHFPFDLNVCQIKLGAYSQSSEEVIFKSGQEVQQLFKHEKYRDYIFNVLPLCDSDHVETSTGFLDSDVIRHSVTGVNLVIGRNFFLVVFESILMMTMLVLVAILATCLPPDSGRGGMVAASMLSIIFVLVTNGEETPHDSGGSNCVLLYNILCLSFICVAYIEYSVVAYIDIDSCSNTEVGDSSCCSPHKRVLLIDRVFFCLSLVFLILLNIVYWKYRWNTAMADNTCHNDPERECLLES